MPNLRSPFRIDLGVACAVLALGSPLASHRALAEGTHASLSGTALSPGVPRIEFARTNYDFGKITQGDIIKAEFVFTNTGSAPLEITSVRPDCGCTAAGTWDKHISPGEIGKIGLSFSSAGIDGKVKKGALVSCNDPSRTSIVLSFAGEVWQPIVLRPLVAAFQSGLENQTNQHRVLRIQSNLEEALKIEGVSVSHTSFTADVSETNPGREFELRLTARPPFTNESTTATVTLKTSSAEVPVIEAKALMTVLPRVAVAPRQVRLPTDPLLKPFEPRLTVYSRATNGVRISNFKGPSGVEINIKELQPGRVYLLHPIFPGGFSLNGRSAELTFETDDPVYPSISVPILKHEGS